MTEHADSIPGGQTPEDHDEHVHNPRSARDKFQRERDGGNGGDAPEVDEFGRTIDNRKKRDRSKSLSPVPVPSGGDRRGKRRRSRSRDREYEGRDGKDSYVPDYSRGRNPRYRQGGNNAGDYGSGLYQPVVVDRYDGRKGDRHSRQVDPMDMDYILTIQAFGEITREQHRKKGGRSTMSNEEIERRFEIYKENFTHKQLQKYFSQEKESEWFREKYHPEDSKPLKEETHNRRREIMAKFAQKLAEGKYDAICYDEKADGGVPPESKDEMKTGEEKAPAVSEEDTMATDEAIVDLELPPKPAVSSEEVYALFIRTVLSKWSRKTLTDVCASIEGFKYLVLSDPRAPSGNRLGWVIFEDGTDMAKAQEALNGKQIDNFTLRVDLHYWQEERTRHVVGEANTPTRLRHDLDQIKRLAAVLDEENEFSTESCAAMIVENRLKTHILSGFEMEVSGGDESADHETAHVKKSLDLYITYLRKVHNYDYYGGIETSSPEDFARKSSVMLRRPPVEKKVSVFLDRLDMRVDLRIRKPLDGPEITKMGGKLLEVELDKFLGKSVKKEAEGKFRCTVCSKLFKGEEFVKKHLKTKHNEITLPTRKEVEFFNNYVRDPNKVDPTRPPQQPSSGPPGSMPGGMQTGGPIFTALPNGAGMPIMMPMQMGGMPMMNMPFMMGSMPNGMQFMQPMQGMMGNVGGRNRNDRGGRGGRNSIQGRLGPAPRRNSKSDPRAVRSYDDLDNPVPSGEMEISYD
ncbi:hypothetical protein PhCBS80983_g02000 [Powellomyces hirtus]|uniref:C2H2-type domain-containing protein n=1 Tax=Powellomyces hirtus TaxID=109895 RepID=A0A507E887_9FUNG|nr:hypothetical protein PhCBS80983_g02000 [Powellomyces hirtus]